MAKNRWTISLILFFALILTSGEAGAQYHHEGDDPSGIVWKRLKSDHYSVIYPQEVDSLARRYLFLFERYRNLTNAGLRIETPTMPVVIHPYNVNSNGVTYWAPRTIDIYSTPPFDYITPQNWETMLVLHEARHVGQISHYRKGFYKFLYVMAGEQTTGILNQSTSFSEGDAVLHETDFTRAGRGRSVDFLRAYRAAFVSDAFVPHETWRFGSFDKYVPNKYAFGYMELAGVRFKTGDYLSAGADFFEQYAKDWWRIFSGTDHGMKKVSGGMTVRTNWNLIETRLTDLWKAEDRMRAPFSPCRDLVRDRGKYYTEYLDPLRLSDGSLVMLKTGMSRTRELVKVDSAGNQKGLTYFSYSASPLVKDSNDRILFSEVIPDHRYGMRSYSVIREYDPFRDKFRNITSRTRYFNPTLSEDEKSIFAVEYKVEGGSSVVEIDRNDGTLLNKTDVPSGGQLSEVLQVAGRIYATVIANEGIVLMRYSDGRWQAETDTVNNAIRHLRRFGKEEMTFTSDFNGMDNVYLVNVKTRDIHRITSSRFGARNPQIDEVTRNLYYSDYDVQGYRPVSVPLDSLERKDAELVRIYEDYIVDALSSQAKAFVKMPSPQEDSVLMEKVQQTESRPYRKISNLFHIHSWFPCYPHMDRIKSLNLSEILYLVEPGLTLISQNSLGTAVTQAAYSYNIKDHLHSGHLNFNYSGWYPVIELQGDLNSHVRTKISKTGERYRLDTLSKPSVDVYARIYVPLDFSRSGWNVGLVPSIQGNFSNDRYNVNGKEMFRQDVTLGLSYYRMLSQPTARLIPRWGFGVTANVRALAGPASIKPEGMMYVNAYGYVPGIFETHGIKLSFSMQKQFTDFYLGSLTNLASVPRGYDKNRILKEYSKVTFDYAIPVYAVEGLRGWLGYVKRMEFIPFVDAALDNAVKIENGYLVNSGVEKMLSYGFDWLLDGHLFRMGMKLSVGFRYAHTITGINYMGVLFNTKL